MKKVSVIIPVYKVEKYLIQCVKSVLNQTYKNIEVILVDDGSPDMCPAICDELAKTDGRIKVIHKKNGGLSDARNYGIEVSTGDFLIFIDSDDYWDNSEGLEHCMRLTTSLDSDVTIFGYKKYYQETGQLETIKMKVPKSASTCLIPIDDLLKDNIFITSAWNKLIKASFFKEYPHIRFVKGQLSEDIEYCSQILLSAKRFAVVPEYFYVYRQEREGSISSNIGRKNITDIAGVIEKYVERAKVPDLNIPLLNYLSLQYILWMTITTLLPAKEIQETLHKMKKLWWITKYDWCPYLKTVKNVRWMGFGITRYLLGIYKKLKS